jgi:hypothetical protein
MRDNVAWTGGAALAVGVLLGVIAERLARHGPNAMVRAVSTPPDDRLEIETLREEPASVTDVLERYRAAAAV